MVNSRSVAAKKARASTRNVPGTCQLWTRTQFDAPSAGDRDRDGDADAVDGWKSEPESARHKDRNAPLGTPVAWSGGRNGFGHRAISLGNGQIRTTDGNGEGVVATRDLGWVERTWGLTYLGWSDTITGIQIPDDTKPAPVVKKHKSQLEVMSYNVQIGDWRDDLKEIRRLAKLEQPDVIFLYEATNLYGHLSVPGYTASQLKPQRLKKGSQPNQAGVAVLIKNGLRKSSVVNLFMAKFWKGPKHGLTQDPRVYKWVKITKGGVTWRVGGFHLPFGQTARAESIARMRTWFRSGLLGQPVVGVSDYNGSKSALTKQIGTPEKAKVAGVIVDLAFYKNCTLIKQKKLEARFNDHPVMDYIFRKY